MKQTSKPAEVDVRVNASCELSYQGCRWGAGAELRLPFEEAVQKAKEGVVTLLVSVNLKEADNGSAR